MNSIKTTHIRPLLRIRALKQFSQNLDARSGLQRNTSQQAAVVYIPQQVLRIRLLVRLSRRALGGAREGGFVVEAI